MSAPTEADAPEVSVAARLRELVRQIVADHPGATVRELAEYVAKLTDAEDFSAFFIELLMPIVEELLSQQRRTALNNNLKPKNRSPKLEQRRKWWADLLAARVHVGDEFKAIGECTVDDLTICVDERKVQIERVQSQISNYHKLIQLMVKHGARTVADLPEQEKWGDA
jgi:hypothetical protein